MIFEPTYKKYEFKDGRIYELAEAGVDGILIFKDAVIELPFAQTDGSNSYEGSLLQKKLEKWWLSTAPDELRDQYDVAPPAIEEVYSQKMLNLWHGARHLTSRQWPIFRDGDERIKSFLGNPCTWWTRSPGPANPFHVWAVYEDGSLEFTHGLCDNAVVPALYPKTKEEKQWN